MDLVPDTLLHNRYRIIRPLGQGGMGSVYLAYDTSLESEVAVKSNRSTSSESTEQFLREARLLAALRHPNLPRVIDYFVLNSGEFLVMDYIPGDDLAAVLEKEGRQPVEKVLEWASQLGSALTYLHNQNPPVIHRDIKPANLKLSAEGEVILVDFGIAKAADISQATATGATGYTPGYAPPEQYGRARSGPYTDQYAFAATLYNLLTGQKPVDSVQRVLGQAVLSPMNLLNPDIPANVQAAIEKAMSIKPDDRFASITDLMRSLGDSSFNPTAPRETAPETAQSATMVAPRVTAPEGLTPSAPARPVRSHILPAVVAILAVIVILALGAAGIGYIFLNRVQVNHPVSTVTQVQVGAIPTQMVDTTTPKPIPATATEISASATAMSAATDTPVPTFTTASTASPTPGPKALGDGKLIAFVSDRADGKTLQIWTMKAFLDNSNNLVSSDLTQLTFDPGDKGQPTWSPDGTKLLYTAPGPPKNGLDVYLLDLSAKDGAPLDVSAMVGDDTDPTWSPDGSLIAYSNTGRFVVGVRSIYISKPDGKDRYRLSQDLIEYRPLWTPDGNWMLTVVFAGDHHYLWRRNTKKDFGTVTPQPYDPSSYFGRLGDVADPAISPDGKTLVYTQIKGKNRSIFSVDFISRGDRINPLTDGQTTEYQPAWSPDEQYIVFTSERDGNPEIYVMTSTGHLQTDLSKSPGTDAQPAWQP